MKQFAIAKPQFIDIIIIQKLKLKRLKLVLIITAESEVFYF